MCFHFWHKSQHVSTLPLLWYHVNRDFKIVTKQTDADNINGNLLNLVITLRPTTSRVEEE